MLCYMISGQKEGFALISTILSNTCSSKQLIIKMTDYRRMYPDLPEPVYEQA